MAAFTDRRYRMLGCALAVTCFLGWLFKAHCLGGGWTGGEQYTTGCYNDAVPFWTGRGVASGELPYFQARMEYPVLTGALIWIEGAVTRMIFGVAADAADFLAVATLANALLAQLVLWFFWQAGIGMRRLWLWVLAPPLILYVGHNWDMLAVALGVAALLAARAGQPLRAAVLSGLGFAAKLFPVLLVPLLGLQALAAPTSWRRRIPQGAAIGAVAFAAWALVNLPVALLARDNWAEFFRFSSARSGTPASIWEIAADYGWASTIPMRNLLAALLFLLGVTLIVGFGWQRHRDRLWLLFTPLLAWFMLTNKVYSPQFDLWLYPMLLLTAPRLLPVILFAVADIAAYFAEFWWLAGGEGAWPSASTGDIALAALVRAVLMLWLIADAVFREPPLWVSRTATDRASD